MSSFPKADFLGLLVRLHLDRATGVISLKEGKREIFFFLKSGDLVYTEGGSEEKALVGEIASRKRLNREETAELTRLGEEEPRRLGKALMDRGLINPSGWRRFLEDKAWAAFVEALAMDSPDISFNQSELGILPINFIHRPAAALVFQSSGRPEKIPRIRDYLEGKNPCFRLNKDMLSWEKDLPLTVAQCRVLSLLEGEKTWPALLQEASATPDGLAQDLHILLSAGLIEEAGPGAERGSDHREHSDIIHLYMALLQAIKAGLGDKQFQGLLGKCTAGGDGPLKILFSALPPIEDGPEGVSREILRRLNSLGLIANRRLLLLTSFNKLLFLMLSRIRKTAGPGQAKELIDAMTKVLVQAEEGKKHPDLMLYLLGNLEDYEKQIAAR